MRLTKSPGRSQTAGLTWEPKDIRGMSSVPSISMYLIRLAVNAVASRAGLRARIWTRFTEMFLRLLKFPAQDRGLRCQQG